MNDSASMDLYATEIGEVGVCLLLKWLGLKENLASTTVTLSAAHDDDLGGYAEGDMNPYELQSVLAGLCGN